MFLDCFYIQFPYFLTTGVFRPEQVRGIKKEKQKLGFT